MKSFKYLIVGGGMTGHAAAAAIREVDPQGTLGMLGDEADPPYARPPLSKGLWAGKPRDSVWLPGVPGLELLTGRRAVALDVARRELSDAAGETYRYQNLLLATGGRPRRLSVGGDRVVYFRTIADYDRLSRGDAREVVVIGAGFIGSEIAASLAQSGRTVTMVFPETGIGANAYPADLSDHVTRYFGDKGVRLLARQTVVEVRPQGERTLVRTSGGSEIVADAVVAGLGIEPNVDLAQRAGIAVSQGIDVDEQLRTSAPGVWAAGDVARFPCEALGGRVRVEHEDNALTMGRVAGRGMAGEAARYDHLPFFYSDLFDLGYEAVGTLDARLDCVESWKTRGREGVCYYLRDGRVRGVLLWGIFGKVDAARELIRRTARTSATELSGAIAL